MLRQEGKLILEIYCYPVEVRRCLESQDGRYRTWYELTESDPFRFYLQDFEYNIENKLLTHRKLFIQSGGGIDESKEEKLRIYSEAEIARILGRAGFHCIQIIPSNQRFCWNMGASGVSQDCAPEIMVIVAEAG